MVMALSAAVFFGDIKAQSGTGRKYYFSPKGNDHNDGSIGRPFKTLSPLEKIRLFPGDQVLLEGNAIFHGSIKVDSSSSGDQKRPVIIASFGKGLPVIESGHSTGLLLFRTAFISIKNLAFSGAGRKNGNTTNGFCIDSSHNITVQNVSVTGYQKTGLFVYCGNQIRLVSIIARGNGAAGIAVEGPYGLKDSNHDIYIGFSRSEDNPGDPTNLTNHSGNGIVVADCKRVLIEYCTATNNGWDMPRIGNGPVGIWAYEADSIIIQHCLSYNNKTSHGGADGGGFDLDGGVTNSVVQYCYSFGNQGAGYSIFQYLYASPWHDNVFRFNIGEDDGTVSDAKAGVHIWNSSRDSNEFYNCAFYNNTIFSSKVSAISFSELSLHKGFLFSNNIFVGKDSLIKGNRGSDIFLGNDWWCLNGVFNIESFKNFSHWARTSGQEMISGKIVGMNIDPAFNNHEHRIYSAIKLPQFQTYRLNTNSKLRQGGINLKSTFKLNTGKHDFLSGRLRQGVGACLN